MDDLPTLARFWLLRPGKEIGSMAATRSRALSLVQPSRSRQKVLTAREKAELQETVLADATLDCVDFARADLRGSRFERVCFRGSDFCAANLVRAWFVGCDLTGVDFTGARLGNNSFFGSRLAGAIGMTRRQKEYIISHGGSFRRGRPQELARQPLGIPSKGARP
jgi:Pentapeptide repeats (8 copies)